MTIEEIIKLREKLPATWMWSKCYELQYRDFNRVYTARHWALVPHKGAPGVVSLNLISQDHITDRQQFMKDEPTQFVEQSLAIVDFLLSEVGRLKSELSKTEEVIK